MRKILLISLTSLLFFSIVGSVQGQTLPLVQCELTGNNRCTFCDFFRMLDRIIDFLLLRIVPVLAALMIAIGGSMYLISQGKPETLNKAKSLFTAIAIGLVIVYGAWVIVNLFLMVIGGTAWNGFGSGWWVIDC